MIVGMNAPALAGLSAQRHGGQVGDHLVDVHLGGGSRSGLEDIEGKLIVNLAAEYFGASPANCLGYVIVQKAQAPVGNGAGRLQAHDGVNDRKGHGFAGRVEIVQGATGMDAVPGTLRDRFFSHAVLFDAHAFSLQRCL